MKKIGFLAILFVLCAGCKKEESKYIKLCDADYVWFFMVKNETGDKEIFISTEYPYGTGYPKQFTLAPGDSGTLSVFATLGSCDAQKPMKELNFGDDFYVVPLSSIIYGPDQFFTMTVDGVEVSHEIWNIRYWPFEADMSDFHKAYYTLTVTDELLDSLPPPDNEN